LSHGIDLDASNVDECWEMEMEKSDHVLVPMSKGEIREIISALKERYSTKASIKIKLLSKLHYHEDWFTTLNQITSDE
jgi:hypothetical protein